MLRLFFMQNGLLKAFYNQSNKQLMELTPEKVKRFKNEIIEDNYTIVIRPNDIFINTIQEYINRLTEIEPNQYYYGVDYLHITILGGIHQDCDVKTIITSVNKTLQKQKLEFQMRGIGSNEYCSSIHALPVNFSLYEVRQELRSSIKQKGDSYSKYLKFYEYIGWMNYLRYTQKPSTNLLNIIKTNKNKDFGKLNASSIEVYKVNSKVPDFKKDKCLYRLTYNL